MFIQLNELNDDQEWRETARWIKYEENVEEGADRWGRPHVSSLSFHSLLNLRKCLESGVVELDLDKEDFPSIIFNVVDMVSHEESKNNLEKRSFSKFFLITNFFLR